MTAPVLLVVLLGSGRRRASVRRRGGRPSSSGYEGRFLAGLVDLDTAPGSRRRCRSPRCRCSLVLLDGRPDPADPRRHAARRAQHALNQLGQQLTTQGVTGRHQPRGGRRAARARRDEPQADPRYAPAQDALAANDIDGAVAEYQKLVDANPADAEAAAGLAMAKVLQRTQGVDLSAAREAAAADPDDVDAQTLVADLDLLGGHVDDAFARLVDLVRRTTDDERDKAREHLLGLFAAVGNDDPRVLGPPEPGLGAVLTAAARGAAATSLRGFGMWRRRARAAAARHGAGPPRLLRCSRRWSCSWNSATCRVADAVRRRLERRRARSAGGAAAGGAGGGCSCRP